MKRHERCYYIGEPKKPHKRGQDKNGFVHCLTWLTIYPKGQFFAKKGEHALGHGGGGICLGIGYVKSIEEARKRIHAYAVQELQEKRENCLDELKRIEKAIKDLGDNPDNIEKFSGEWKLK